MRKTPAAWNAIGATLGFAWLGVAEAQVITTVAGGGPNNLPALSANFNVTSGVAVDAGGNLFISTSQNRIFKVDGSGQLVVVAGNGFPSFGGDGGPAVDANLKGPTAVASDGAGGLYFVDRENYRVRRVDATTGIITTAAGNGSSEFSGDEGPATSAGMRPVGIALDAAGNLLISGNGRIRRVDSESGTISTIAGDGSGSFSGDGGLATSAGIAAGAIAFDAEGDLFIAGGNRVRRIDAGSGIITTVAGNGTIGFSGDGGPATSASTNGPNGVALDAHGNLFISDSNNLRIRRVDNATGIIRTVAGNGCVPMLPFPSVCPIGDGFSATSASLMFPTGVALDAADNLLIADSYHLRVRRVDSATAIITTIAGNGSFGFSGDGSAATNASLYGPVSVASDAAGNLVIADRDNQRVRRVKASNGIITTIAGSGIRGSGTASFPWLSDPASVAVDGDGNVFIADQGNFRILRVDASSGIVTSVAGNGVWGFSGDGGPATSAMISAGDVAADSVGNLFIADAGRVRRVDAVTGIIDTVAGDGSFIYSGDGGPATSAGMTPTRTTLDAAGNLFIADSQNNRIRRVDAATGIITTVAGNGHQGFSGDGGPATSARLSIPRGIAVDADGNLFIADSQNNRIRRVDAGSGIITTVAGNGCSAPPWSSGCFGGDGGEATAASLAWPFDVALDAVGNLVIADRSNNRIRMVGDAVVPNRVEIDIKPASTPNSINLSNEGVIPVAILGSETFDVSEVDGASLRFAGGATPVHDLADPVVFDQHLDDVNRDGLDDLVTHCYTEETGIAFGESTACLRGETVDHVRFSGCDAIRTVPDIDGDGLMDLDEQDAGTNAFYGDTDGDGYDDGAEVLRLGTDPLDALDPEPAPVRAPTRRARERR